LEALAKIHKSEENYAEAAYCHLHILAIIADYLQNSQDTPLDTSIFQIICPGISEAAV
jgi:hypothetical protein